MWWECKNHLSLCWCQVGKVFSCLWCSLCLSLYIICFEGLPSTGVCIHQIAFNLVLGFFSLVPRSFFNHSFIPKMHAKVFLPLFCLRQEEKGISYLKQSCYCPAKMDWRSPFLGEEDWPLVLSPFSGKVICLFSNLRAPVWLKHF